MERAMNDGMKTNWAERLSPAMRIGAILLLTIVLLFLMGVIIGFTVAAIDHGHAPRKPLAYLVLAAMLGTAIAAAWAMRTVIRSRPATALSRFDRRYYRMWYVLGALGVPLGIGLALAADPKDSLAPGFWIFSNSVISPAVAIGLALFTAISLSASAVVYHRTIDDHEERAYLWGSTIAFYFLAIAFPIFWLLVRGGVIEPLGIGTAMIILLTSFVAQTAVWLWFKFR